MRRLLKQIAIHRKHLVAACIYVCATLVPAPLFAGGDCDINMCMFKTSAPFYECECIANKDKNDRCPASSYEMECRGNKPETCLCYKKTSCPPLRDLICRGFGLESLRACDCDGGISVKRINDLAFGGLANTKGRGSVTIDSTSGIRTTTGALVTTDSKYRLAEFEVTGPAGASFRIQLPENATLQNTSGNSGSIRASKLESTPSSRGTLNSSGRATVKVGGTLTVSSRIPEGNYEGAFDITVDLDQNSGKGNNDKKTLRDALRDALGQIP